MASRTVIVSMLTGTIVTLVASIVPALKATRVPPISAVREGSRPRRHRPGPQALRRDRGRRLLAGADRAGLFGGVMIALTFSVGVLALFVGIAMLAPRLVKPLATLVGSRPPPRRLARPARPRQRAAQPRPHGLHGRGADDRPRAGHRRRHARRGPARLDRRRRQAAGQGRLRRHRQGRRRLVHLRLRRGVRLRRRRQGHLRRAHATPARSPARSPRSRASTRRRSTTSTTYEWAEGSLAGLGRRRRARGPRASPRSTT